MLLNDIMLLRPLLIFEAVGILRFLEKQTAVSNIYKFSLRLINSMENNMNTETWMS